VTWFGGLTHGRMSRNGVDTKSIKLAVPLCSCVVWREAKLLLSSVVELLRASTSGDAARGRWAFEA